MRNMLVYDTKGQQSHIQGRRKERGYWGVVKTKGGRSGRDGSKDGEVDDGRDGEEENDRGDDKDEDLREIGNDEGSGDGEDVDNMPPLLAPQSHRVHHHQRNLESDGEESEEDLHSWTLSRPFRVPITPAIPTFRPDIHAISTLPPLFDNPTPSTIGMGYYQKAEKGMLPPIPEKGFIDSSGMSKKIGRRTKTPPINLWAIEGLGERKKREAAEAEEDGETREAGGEKRRLFGEREGGRGLGIVDEKKDEEDDERIELGRSMRGLSLSPTPSRGPTGAITATLLSTRSQSEASEPVIHEDVDVDAEDESEYFSDGENESRVREDNEVDRRGRGDLLPRERRVVLGELSKDDPRLRTLDTD